jgi:hypothetical protein
MHEVEVFIQDWPRWQRSQPNKQLNMVRPMKLRLLTSAGSTMVAGNVPLCTVMKYLTIFPPHTDVIENVINYEVPVEMLTELGRYDSSLYVDRTRDEASAWHNIKVPMFYHTIKIRKYEKNKH